MPARARSTPAASREPWSNGAPTGRSTGSMGHAGSRWKPSTDGGSGSRSSASISHRTGRVRPDPSSRPHAWPLRRRCARGRRLAAPLRRCVWLLPPGRPGAAIRPPQRKADGEPRDLGVQDAAAALGDFARAAEGGGGTAADSLLARRPRIPCHGRKPWWLRGFPPRSLSFGPTSVLALLRLQSFYTSPSPIRAGRSITAAPAASDPTGTRRHARRSDPGLRNANSGAHAHPARALRITHASSDAEAFPPDPPWLPDILIDPPSPEAIDAVCARAELRAGCLHMLRPDGSVAFCRITPPGLAPPPAAGVPVGAGRTALRMGRAVRSLRPNPRPAVAAGPQYTVHPPAAPQLFGRPVLSQPEGIRRAAVERVTFALAHRPAPANAVRRVPVAARRTTSSSWVRHRRKS